MPQAPPPPRRERAPDKALVSIGGGHIAYFTHADRLVAAPKAHASKISLALNASALLSIVAALWAVLAAGPSTAAAADFRSLSYSVSLSPNFVSRTISGVERLRFQSLSARLDALSFTANPLLVDATLNGARVATTTEDGKRTFHLPRRLAKGEVATLTMSFIGRPERDVVFTADEIHTGFFTCEVMVCDDDRPDDRAKLQLTLTLPIGLDAVAPGRLVSRTPAGPGQEAWRWREDRAYPSYLYGFAAGRFARATLEGGGTPSQCCTLARRRPRCRPCSATPAA